MCRIAAQAPRLSICSADRATRLTASRKMPMICGIRPVRFPASQAWEASGKQAGAFPRAARYPTARKASGRILGLPWGSPIARVPLPIFCDVLPAREGSDAFPSSETARLHHASRWRGSGEPEHRIACAVWPGSHSTQQNRRCGASHPPLDAMSRSGIRRCDLGAAWVDVGTGA